MKWEQHTNGEETWYRLEIMKRLWVDVWHYDGHWEILAAVSPYEDTTTLAAVNGKLPVSDVLCLANLCAHSYLTHRVEKLNYYAERVLKADTEFSCT